MTLFYQFHFYLFGLIAVASGVLFVTRKSPVAAVLWLVGAMTSLAALYVMMGAHFVGAVQVIIYAGAIMVVFLFVVMLLNLGHADAVADIRARGGRYAAGAAGLVIAAFLLATARQPLPPATPDARPANAIVPVAEALYRDYVLAFEAASLVLLAAIVAAVVLAKRSART